LDERNFTENEFVEALAVNNARPLLLILGLADDVGHHMLWNVLREDRMEPPILTLNFLSAGATTFTLILEDVGQKQDLSGTNRYSPSKPPLKLHGLVHSF
jgi:hypothetical protein